MLVTYRLAALRVRAREQKPVFPIGPDHGAKLENHKPHPTAYGPAHFGIDGEDSGR